MSVTAVAEAPAADIVWAPQDGPQLEFHRRPEFEVLYGGARGGGKTDSLIVEGLRQVHLGSYRAIFFRRTYPQLSEVLDRAHQIIPRVAPGAHWDGEGKRWLFPSGAVYRFAHLQNEGDQANYQGHQYAYLAFDELTHFSERMYRDLLATCRTPDPQVRAYVRASANPGGIGHTWVKERFVDRCPAVRDGEMRYEPLFEVWWQPMRPGPPYTDPETGLTRAFVPSRVFDNRRLLDADPAYVRRLLSLPEDVRRAWLEGDWETFEGRVYPEFRRDTHVVEPYPIPRSWQRFRSIDVGFTNPTACLWGAWDGEYLVIYAEHYEVGKPVSWHVDRIREISGSGWSGMTVMDPAADQRTAAAQKSAMAQYAEHGIYAAKARNEVWPGIQRVKEFLRVRDDGYPRLLVFSTCTNLIRELSEYQWDPHATAAGAPRETPLKVRDHAVDALRYMCMALPRQWAGREDDKDDTAAPEGDEPTSYRRVVRWKAAGY
ncbi:MAG TPA: terminase family protein [Limnochordia bacterium]